nr:immunoglobulin light chain junction region [Macaca mulatta]MOW36724.1 immunoglobulin light chain junction region [Macaca mulatta]MOW36800.1 immunoglobulin light chain junction region [Macaca mulatta]MOW38500.1 immunoglobulin light chain junction region [Macaca mulatta]MOW38697.1 immunoglobulin light chain junction region [Macaca mulatta]
DYYCHVWDRSSAHWVF